MFFYHLQKISLISYSATCSKAASFLPTNLKKKLKPFYKNYNLFLITILCVIIALPGYSFDEDSEVSIGVKRGSKIRKKTGIKKPKRKKKSLFFKLNTKKTFEKVKKHNAYVFLIGNDGYTAESGFSMLGQCYNDVRLLKQIFIQCTKIDEKHIFANKDLTLADFRKRFKDFVEIVKKDKKAVVMITYSGHGNDDGSLVFIKGGMLRPAELKNLVNSFKNDTILILDACYSGSNEGPKEMFKKTKQEQFKSNSIRIYASLAHLTAKEIKYSNSFFKHIKPFYRDVLKLKDIEGNGYFTAMVGLFFAEYKFKKDENISFKDIISYVTNRGKTYVEYLAFLGNQFQGQKKAAKVRLNQQPKILPITERVQFSNINHNFILIQKPIEPVGLEPGVTGGLFFPMGSLGESYTSPAITTTINLGYNIFHDNLFLDLAVTYMSLSSGSSTATRDVTLAVLIPALGIVYRPFKLSFFSITVGAHAGYAFTFFNAGSFGPVKEESSTFANLYIGSNVGFNFEVFKDFNIVIPVRFTYIGYSDEPLYGVSTELGASYYF